MIHRDAPVLDVNIQCSVQICSCTSTQPHVCACRHTVCERLCSAHTHTHMYTHRKGKHIFPVDIQLSVHTLSARRDIPGSTALHVYKHDSSSVGADACAETWAHSFQLAHTHRSVHVTYKYRVRVRLVDWAVRRSLSHVCTCVKPVQSSLYPMQITSEAHLNESIFPLLRDSFKYERWKAANSPSYSSAPGVDTRACHS